MGSDLLQTFHLPVLDSGAGHVDEALRNVRELLHITKQTLDGIQVSVLASEHQGSHSFFVLFFGVGTQPSKEADGRGSFRFIGRNNIPIHGGIEAKTIKHGPVAVLVDGTNKVQRSVSVAGLRIDVAFGVSGCVKFAYHVIVGAVCSIMNRYSALIVLLCKCMLHILIVRSNALVRRHAKLKHFNRRIEVMCPANKMNGIPPAVVLP
mmetsp:Transcript_8930/g.18045  ORF Transcript_8930/g.18045 Transcript_8930/m.18045 type:complete len:207 (+) Transcript_8930:601-1221(+)